MRSRLRLLAAGVLALASAHADPVLGAHLVLARGNTHFQVSAVASGASVKRGLASVHHRQPAAAARCAPLLRGPLEPRAGRVGAPGRRRRCPSTRPIGRPGGRTGGSGERGGDLRGQRLRYARLLPDARGRRRSPALRHRDLPRRGQGELGDVQPLLPAVEQRAAGDRGHPGSAGVRRVRCNRDAADRASRGGCGATGARRGEPRIYADAHGLTQIVKAPLTECSGERSFPLYPIDPFKSAEIRGSP